MMGNSPGGRTQTILTNPNLAGKLLKNGSNPFAEDPSSMACFNVGDFTL
jgi:hypothetical protein